MNTEKEINLSDYTYPLPDERIAKYPLAKRDQSKLLYYHKGSIKHKGFNDIQTLLPDGATLFFNNTKVIPARLIFHKATGAQIEIFLLKPIAPSPILSIVMEERQTVVWECMIGNFKKWKEEIPLERVLTIGPKKLILKASIENRESRQIKFSWNDSFHFIFRNSRSIGKSTPSTLLEQATRSRR